ncbi:PDC sensor domain-containing protein [Arthrobacter sp. NPDC055585]
MSISRSDSPPPSPAAQPADLGRFFQDLLEILEEWKPLLEELFSGPDARPSRREVDAVVEPLTTTLLGRTDYPLAGGGFVAAHEALADAPWHMAWWQGRSKEVQVVLSSVESMGEAYSRREWFTVPLETGASHVTGPYVDFICTDEYTVTLTSPVRVGGTVVGVVGADVFVESLEEVLLPDLRAVHPEASLVNRVGRVVVSADPQLAAGRLLVGDWRQTPDPARMDLRGPEYAGRLAAVHPCGSLPLAVVVPA